MCNNAMVYNAPETIYYKAAKKLVQSGSKLLSPVSTYTSAIIKLIYCTQRLATALIKIILLSCLAKCMKCELNFYVSPVFM